MKNLILTAIAVISGAIAVDFVLDMEEQETCQRLRRQVELGHGDVVPAWCRGI